MIAAVREIGHRVPLTGNGSTSAMFANVAVSVFLPDLVPDFYRQAVAPSWTIESGTPSNETTVLVSVRVPSVLKEYAAEKPFTGFLYSTDYGLWATFVGSTGGTASAAIVLPTL